ncbi:hypothetical protein [Prosthecobacter sp.]
MKNVALVRKFETMFPPAQRLVNDTDRLRHLLLIHALAAPCLQHSVSSSILGKRVAAEKREDPRPLRNDGLSLVTFPAVINLTQGTELAGHSLLAQSQCEPAIAEVLTQSPWLLDHAFLSQHERFKCAVCHPNRKVAKWQNRMIPFLDEKHMLHALFCLCPSRVREGRRDVKSCVA